MNLKPFFCYYGGKWRAASSYPKPLHDRIIEPFAGAAGYSVRHHERDVLLIDRDPTIVALWRYLIGATEDDIMGLPAIVETTVADMGLPVGPSALIGFWLNKGAAAPRQRPSAWMRSGIRRRSYWGAEVRERIASQVGAIKHWRVEQDEWDAVDWPGGSTAFVDPPYQGAPGRHYRFNEIDYASLGRRCIEHSGQVIACENEGADWLPFRSHRSIKSMHGGTRSGVSREVVWSRSE